MPKIVDPIAMSEIFVIILLVSVNSWSVHTIKNNHIVKNMNPGIP